MGEINTTFFNNLDNATTWSAGVAFKRSKALPLDKYSVFKSKELAIEYAEKTGAYAETPVSYPGQIIAVSENGKMIAYVLTENLESNKLELQQIGVIPAGDNISIKVDKNGIISLSGLDTIQEIEDEDGNPITYQPRYKNGKLTWEKLSSTTMEDVGVQLKGLEEDIKDLEESILTENDVKSLITDEAAKFNKAVFEKVEFLPDPLLAQPNILYLLPIGDKFEIHAKIGDELVHIDDTDLSLEGYATKDDIKDFVKTETLNDYVLSSVLDTLISKSNLETELKASATIIDLLAAAEKAHGHENKTILDTITQELIDKWNQSEANVINNVSEEFSLTDKTLIINKIKATKIEGLDTKITDAIDEKLKDFNGTILDSISINDTKLTIDENKNIDLPIASNTVLGLIYGIGSDQENKVSIEEDGTLTVNSLNVNKLVQTNNEFLVLNGGDASLSPETNN